MGWDGAGSYSVCSHKLFDYSACCDYVDDYFARVADTMIEVNLNKDQF